MKFQLSAILFLMSTAQTFGQVFFSPNPSVSVQPTEIKPFLAAITEVDRKASYYNISPAVLQTVLVLQSNAGKSVADGQFNYGRALSSDRLAKFPSFAQSKNGFVVCDHRSRGVEVAAVCLHFLRANEKKPLTDAQWIKLVFGKGGDLASLSADADGIYQAITGKQFRDLDIDSTLILSKLAAPAAAKTEEPVAQKERPNPEPPLAKKLEEPVKAAPAAPTPVAEQPKTEEPVKATPAPEPVVEQPKIAAAAPLVEVPIIQPEPFVPQPTEAQASSTLGLRTDGGWNGSGKSKSNSKNGQFKGSTESKLVLFGGFGNRALKYDDLSVYFEYVDESPSQDHIATYFELPGRSRVTTLHLGGEQVQESRMVFRLSGELYLNKVRGGGAELAAGYQFGKASGINVRPSLGLGLNYTNVALGKIYQNDLFIQVNETKFYSQSVNVRLSSPSLSLRPEVAVGVPLSSNVELRAAVGYHLGLARFESDLRFSGDDEEGNSVNDSKPLKAANAALYIDGEPLKASFAKPSGLFLNVCVGWRL